MAVEANTVASLFDKLKVDDPWVPPKPWESIPSESGCFSSDSQSESSHSLYHISTLSESSLVRLAMNALQGVESALITVDKLSGLFCSDSADRTFHRISNLWILSSSTLALGNLLKSIGQFGSIIFLLHKFIVYFLHLNPDGNSELEENLGKDNNERKELPKCNLSLVNQAFAVAVKKVLDGYISALNTLHASVSVRRALKSGDGGCLMDIGNAEITLLEIYLHTKGLRIQMEALGNICHISDIALGFPVSSFESLIVKANLAFANFPRGGSLLTFLYMQLKVVDPVHCALLKFLFLQSCEPYFGFIRSWIYEGRISDPYKEFVVEHVENLPACALGNSGISIDFPLNTVRVRDGVKLPYFLEEFLIPLLRAGQQLQVVVKLLELCNTLCTCNATHEEILPFLEDIPSEYPIFASALTFQKGSIENMTLTRKSYYERLQVKVENILSKFEFRSQQASQNNVQLLYALNHGSSVKPDDSLVDDDILIPNVIGWRDENRVSPTSNNEVSEDELLSVEDFLESSESASLDSFEEQNESQEAYDNRRGLEPNYFSSLGFSFSPSADQLAQKPSLSHLMGSFSSKMCERRKDACQAIGSYHERTGITSSSPPHEFGEPDLFRAHNMECTDNQHEVGLPYGCMLDDHSCVDEGDGTVAGLDLTGSQLKVKSQIREFWRTDITSSSDTIQSGNISLERASDKNEHSDETTAFPNASNEFSWGSKYDSKFFSTNPILSKPYFFNCNKAGESNSMNYREALPFFDFTSIRDPHKVFEEKLASCPRRQIGAEFSILPDMAAGDASDMSGPQNKEGYGYENSKKKITSTDFHFLSNSKAANSEDTSQGNITEGRGWETLLACFCKTPALTAKSYRNILPEVFEMPLDYVIKKCLWEQILLQYKYVSKLTIKLLEEGFNLQEHLLTLRRYHFMDLADWADLFILSLWHHKWYMVDADKRIPEIQGALESSVQRSSCEGDPNKDRLYLYMKRDRVLSKSANGVRSFDFLGLGYRVEWPITIILTPGALKIYSEIFNFLIQVKLAVFSLSDTWCLLKDLVQSTKRIRRQELPKLTLHHICLLTETRHQINHFVSTLQQYVQSQLSHVAWHKFLTSLKHKVKDMMDLEVVHMAYLTESLQICFLSDETVPIASIIQSILQIAMDFRSCLVGHSMKIGPSGEDSFSELSQIDVAQVLAIKKTFMKDLEDLYLCYLKSPKHSEHSLSHFWDYLNFNDYYSEIVDKQLGPHVLSY